MPFEELKARQSVVWGSGAKGALSHKLQAALAVAKGSYVIS